MKKLSLEKTVTLTDVRRSALNLLARREHSGLELKQKLQIRGYPIDLINLAIERLKGQGLLDENRFVESFINSRINKGYGPLRIAAELQQRGVSADLIEQNLEKNTEEWQEQAELIRQKRFGQRIPKDFAEQAKQMRFLQYRGFDFTQIKKLFISSFN